MSALTIANLRKNFGPVEVLKGVDLEARSGEFIALVGPSGCGKSTLLAMIAGLETVSSGEIRIDGRLVNSVAPKDRDIAMVFQSYALYPTMTVRQNITFGMESRHVPRAAQDEAVKRVAALLQIEPLLQRKPGQLSGGQRQRVAMGRALVRDPKLFLFDEPLSNLDAKLRVTMRAEIRRLQRRMGVTSLYVTHDQVEAMTLGDRLLVLHQGKPVQLATPMEVFERPADVYVAGFIGAPAMNFLPGKLSHGGSAVQLDLGPLVPFADGRRAGADGRALIVGIRPEHVVMDPAGLELQVDLVEPLGSETVAIGRLSNGEMFSVKFPASGTVAETLRIALPAAALHVFDAQTEQRLDAA